MNTKSGKLLFIPLALAAVALLPSNATAADHPAKITQVIGGLHSPRGLAFGPGERLFVAEAGDDTAGSSIIELVDADAAHPQVQEVVTGLPTTGSNGEFSGIEDVAISGNAAVFQVYGVFGLSPHEAGTPFGSLFIVDHDFDSKQAITNVGRFDFDWTGDHKKLVPSQFPDANPFNVLVVSGHIYVVDAAANTLDEVMPDGSVKVLAFFPNTPLSDAVPTCIAQGPDGLLYIGTLALVDSVFNGPAAKVYRLDPSQANLAKPWQTPLTVFASGLFPITGCAFGPDGNLYVSQLFTNPAHDFGTVFSDPHGDVIKIPFGNPAKHISLTGGTLSGAGGVAVSGDGDVFVSDGTAHVAPGTGSIVRISFGN